VAEDDEPEEVPGPAPFAPSNIFIASDLIVAPSVSPLPVTLPDEVSEPETVNADVPCRPQPSPLTSVASAADSLNSRPSPESVDADAPVTCSEARGAQNSALGDQQVIES
jgi:hypothetical protein